MVPILLDPLVDILAVLRLARGGRNESGGSVREGGGRNGGGRISNGGGSGSGSGGVNGGKRKEG